jgi:hypothetical protein
MSEWDWDDTALLQAYDAAVSGKRSSAQEKQSKKQKPSVPTPQQAKTEASSSSSSHVPTITVERPAMPSVSFLSPRAPMAEVQDEKLARVLQSYFDAGFALKEYLASRDE